MTYVLLLNCALKLVEEIILYYDARSKKHQIGTRCFKKMKRSGVDALVPLITWQTVPPGHALQQTHNLTDTKHTSGPVH